MLAPDAGTPRQKAKVAVLLVLPILIIIVMAVRTVMLDRAAAQTRATDAVQHVLKAYAAQLGAAIARLTADKLKDVSANLAGTNDPVLALRGFVHVRRPAFATLFSDTQRIFPPEDDAAQLWQERRALIDLGAAIDSARQDADLNGAGTAWGQLAHAVALVTCEKSGTTRTLCVAVTQDEFQSIFDGIFESRSLSLPQTLLLIDPWGVQRWPVRVVQTEEPAISLDLAAPLKGWKIRANVSANSGYAAVAISATVLLITAGWVVALVLLLRQQVEAARQHRARAESAARLSHDLRTPIANLAIYVDLVGRHGRENKAIIRCCEALTEEIARLAIIAERTLQRSRGQVAPLAERGMFVSVDKVVSNLTERYAPLMSRAGCSIRFEAGAPDALVDDQMSLERIVINLFDNARLHASGARVTVTTRQSCDRILLSICDDGAHRVSPTRDDVANNGLGLKVVEEIAHSRGGTFLASIDKAGSRFEISLPSMRVTTP